MSVDKKEKTGIIGDAYVDDERKSTLPSSCQREPQLVKSGAGKKGNMVRESFGPTGRVKREVPIQTCDYIRIVSDKPRVVPRVEARPCL